MSKTYSAVNLEYPKYVFTVSMQQCVYKILYIFCETLHNIAETCNVSQNIYTILYTHCCIQTAETYVLVFILQQDAGI
jgi:hypothetical protein